jgi:tetratricopeptide (TPR) repeat protein
MRVSVPAFALAFLVVGPGASARKPDPPARLTDAERALRVGRYEDARRLAGARGGSGAGPAGAAILGARAEQALGLYTEARRRLEAVAEAAPDDLPVRDALMRLYEATGDRAALAPLIDRSYQDWNQDRVDKSHAANLQAIATAVRLDNNWKDASDTLRDAVKAEPRAVEPNLDWGQIFLARHAASEAEVSFRKVLEVDADNPEAHVGLAHVALDQRYDGAAARQEIARALAVNPRHAGALALRAELALDAEDLAAAAADVAALRRTNPRDPGAAAIAATAALLVDDDAGYRRERDQHLGVHPADGDFFAFVADALTRQRRYDEARAVAEEGVKLDPDSARCLSVLGTTLARLGEEDGALEALRRAWKRDPYDTRTYNLLNLFEKVIPSRYVTIATAHLRFRVEPATRPAIEAVVAPFLEQTYAHYVQRYGMEPRGPVVFELYGDPEHYAVRTVGLPDISVAGVCFGRVITAQAPSNHVVNWGMVLAHELAHVFAIQISRSRVPRWFTEGLSEVETMRARPEWTRHDDVSLWGAWRRGELPPITELSNSFINARSSDDAARAYAHAALAMDFLERRFGFPRIRAALEAYGRGERGPGVIERLAGMPAADLERLFRDELAVRWKRYDAQYVPTETLRLKVKAAGGKGAPAAPASPANMSVAELEAARAELGRAARPSADDQAALYFISGELALRKQDGDAAVAAMQGLLALTPPRDGYDVRLRLALAETRLKQPAAAEENLQKAVAFDPSRIEPHAMLAELYGDQGRDADRATQMDAVLALEAQSAKLAKELVLASARAGRTSRVLATAPVAIFIDPADPDMHAALGRAQAATGQPAAAAASLERALLFKPADPKALHLTLAELYGRLGENAKAAAHRVAAAKTSTE